MACTDPISAWQGQGGRVMLREPTETREGLRFLSLPCGRCLSCRLARGRAWAIRCQLELQSHSEACWCTLTYCDKYLPPTLDKSHLSGFLKRLRARSATAGIRFFGCGEYGERNGRPHYHSILFGTADRGLIERSWSAGHVRVDELSPASIAYVAGYTTKKAAQPRYWSGRECVDPDTGEVYEHQEPFVLMSRRPGIGGAARQYWRSWRSTAVWHGQEVAVPRFLHAAWLLHASPEAVESLARERAEFFGVQDRSRERLRAAAQIALAKHSQSAERRPL